MSSLKFEVVLRPIRKKIIHIIVVEQKSTPVRFELTRSKSNGLAIHRLNHSATVSYIPTHGENKFIM